MKMIPAVTLFIYRDALALKKKADATRKGDRIHIGQAESRNSTVASKLEAAIFDSSSALYR